MTHTVVKKFEVTDEQIDDIMSAAMNGIAYWCDQVVIRGKVNDEHDGIWSSEGLTRGYALRIHDEEEDKWHVLTINKFLKGMGMMDNMDIEQYDMNDADSIIQYALFGEQVYA